MGMNKRMMIIALIIALLAVVLGEYLYSISIEWYRYLIWGVALLILLFIWYVVRSLSKSVPCTVYDDVTGLPNADLFKETLRQTIAYANRHAQKIHILYIGLKDFATINELHGEEVGDSVLAEVAKRLRDNLRESDIIAHIDLDAFVVIPRDLQEEKYFYEVVDKLSEIISQPMNIGDINLSVDVEISSSFYPDNGLNVEELMEYGYA
jgi:diguanylate cyclase (GGDEF)-like protein